MGQQVTETAAADDQVKGRLEGEEREAMRGWVGRRRERDEECV